MYLGLAVALATWYNIMSGLKGYDFFDIFTFQI